MRRQFLLLCATGALFVVAAAQDTAGTGAAVGGPPASWTLKGSELLADVVEGDGARLTYAFGLEGGKLGRPAKLLRGAERASWSGSHKLIVYIKGGYIWVADLTGKTRRLCPVPERGWRDEFDPPVFWGPFGRAYAFERLPAFGSRLARSLDLHDEMKISDVKFSPLISGGFGEFIIPFSRRMTGHEAEAKSSEILSIGAASFSPDGKTLAAAVFPSMPYDLGAGQSKIILFDLVDLSKRGAELDAEFAQVETGWFSSYTGVDARVKPHRTLLPGSDDRFIDTDPLYSPDGRWLAFTRLDKEMETVLPCIRAADKNYAAVRLVLDSRSSKQYDPMERWGWPNIRAVAWENKDTLWLIAGARDLLYRARPTPSGTWETTSWAFTSGSHGIHIERYAFRNGWLAWTNAFYRDIIMFCNTATGMEVSAHLPPNSEVKWLSW